MLELVGHDVADLGQPQRRIDVVVAADDDQVGDGRCRATGIGVEHGDPVAHRARRHPEHAPELAASEDADRRGRLDRLDRGLV